MFYNVYLIDECYVGITLKNPEQRLQEHVIQAVKNHGTRKDKYIFGQLLLRNFPKVQPLFTSVWSDEDLAIAATTSKTPMTVLAGADEEAVCIYYRDHIGLDLMNIAAGTTTAPLNRAIVVGKTSQSFNKWLDSHGGNAKPTLLPKSQVRAAAKNTVTYDDDSGRTMVVTPHEISYFDHNLSGPNTRSICYKWDNSWQDPAGFIHGKTYDHKTGKMSKPFIDTYRMVSDMVVGQPYRVFSEKWLAPDDPETTKCWSWAAHEPFNFETVKASLEARLERIKQLPEQLQGWNDMELLETSTRSTLRHLIETHAEREGKPFTTTALLQFLDK